MSLATSIYIVYETTNLVNGKYYIGVHKENGKNYLGSGKKLKLAIDKYGRENFIRETLREFDNYIDAYDYERLIVDENLVNDNNCYNLKIGGYGSLSGENNPMYGKCHSDETKRKIGENQKGHKRNCGSILSDETKRKISNNMKGHTRNLGMHHSESTKKKMSDLKKGKHLSSETKQKMREARSNISNETREKLSESHKGEKNHASKKCYINGKKFNTFTDASLFFEVSRRTIYAWCKSPKHPECYIIL